MIEPYKPFSIRPNLKKVSKVKPIQHFLKWMTKHQSSLIIAFQEINIATSHALWESNWPVFQSHKIKYYQSSLITAFQEINLAKTL